MSDRQWRFVGVNKFGENPSVDATSNPADVVNIGSVTYTWPAAAATTTMVCADADDTAVGDGAGAQEVTVQGVDTNGAFVSQVVATNGGTVTLGTDLLRCFRAKVTAVGTTTWNEGNIDIKHGATVIARIPATQGQTQMGIYTIPTDYTNGAYIMGWYIDIGNQTGAFIRATLKTREWSGAWLEKTSVRLQTTGNSRVESPPYWRLKVPARTDILWRVTSANKSGLEVSAGFDVWQVETVGRTVPEWEHPDLWIGR